MEDGTKCQRPGKDKPSLEIFKSVAVRGEKNGKTELLLLEFDFDFRGELLHTYL